MLLSRRPSHNGNVNADVDTLRLSVSVNGIGISQVPGIGLFGDQSSL